MRAVVFEGVGKVAVRDVPDPVLADPGDAILRVQLSGICGSDLHFLHGKAPVAAGDVMGHEAVGVVEEVGSAVRRFRAGDRVVPSFHVACGACWFCGLGQTQLCEESQIFGAGTFGGRLAGTQAEGVRVPRADFNLLWIPEAVDDERAVFLGDVATTGVYAAWSSEAGPDDVVAVVGVGPVGYCAVQALAERGVGAVLALDKDPARLALAERAGALPIDVAARHPQAAVAEMTGGRGADVVVEAVGHPEAFETAVDIVRRGGRVVVAGMYAGEQVQIQLGVYWARALDVRFAGICPVHAWWDQTLAAVADGRLDPSPLVSHRLPLEEGPHGYEVFDGREATKVVLRP